jgi:hypothetical protein
MRILLGLAMVALVVRMARTDETKPKEVKFDQHSGYFEKRTSGLKGDSSYLAIADMADFDKTFGVGFVMGKKPNVVPKDAWGKIQIAAVIKRGNATFDYTIEKVTRTGDKLTVDYKATKGAETSGMFATPLVLSVEKGDYKEVVFVENGKEAATIPTRRASEK